MKKVTKIDQVQVASLRKIRVAAYCRVSSEKDEQAVSLETQKSHYDNYIRSNNDWEYAGLYFDDGITGTKKEVREGLLSLVEDCEKGLIDLVITKSISRFSRNTTDCLELVRKLQNYDVSIYFEKENINTGSMESELMLAVLSSLAEAESVSISENEKWSVKKRFENGSFIVGYPPYGYDNVDGSMVIVPEQAEVVRKIFSDTLSGKSTHAIAKELNSIGIKSKKDNNWSSVTVNAIIRNEKYTGDALFQKTYTDDSFKRHHNSGEQAQYLCRNHHEPIVSHEIFNKANEVIKQRGLEKGNYKDTKKYQNRYGFSGRIICGECGGTFKRRAHYKSGGNYIAWSCDNHIKDKNSCSMLYIEDEDVKLAFVTLMNKLRFGNDLVLKPLLNSICTTNSVKTKLDIKEIETEMENNQEQRKQMKNLLSKGYLNRSVFIKAHNQLVAEYDNLICRCDLIKRMNESGYTMEQSIKDLVDFLNKSEVFTEFEDSLFERFVEKITVVSRKQIIFELKFGLKLTERLG